MSIRWLRFWVFAAVLAGSVTVAVADSGFAPVPIGARSGPIWTYPDGAVRIDLGPTVEVDPPLDRQSNSVEYDQIFHLPVVDWFFALSTAVDPPHTTFFVGDLDNDTINIHTVTSNLVVSTGSLPMTYGLPLLATDLDLDGEVELVVQRGDFNGGYFLDIHSAPTWRLRSRIALVPRLGGGHAIAVNTDSDPELEISYVSEALGTVSLVMVVDFDPESGSFVVADSLAGPVQMGGITLAHDVDFDGRVEIISGTFSDHYQYEVIDGVIEDRGMITDAVGGHYAALVQPIPGEPEHLLLGDSSVTQGWKHQLMRVTGDNQFESAWLAEEANGWYSIQPWGFGLDADNDNIDELMLWIAPTVRHLEWDPAAQDFVITWTMDVTGGDSLQIRAATDLDGDGIPEWCGSGYSASGGSRIIALEQRGAPLFGDGFENGSTSWWWQTVPE